MEHGKKGIGLLSTSKIGKVYTTPVLKDADFELFQGEVHALVGENGAGKSTFAKIISGIVKPTSGTMKLFNKPYKTSSRVEAEKYGIRMVTQELNLINTLSVAENLFLNRLPNLFGVVQYSKLYSDSKEILKRVGLDNINLKAAVKDLGIGQQQMIEIASCLIGKCRLLILDEPTAMLTEREIKLLFNQIRNLTENGVGIIYISHRLQEIKQIADRITVLRDGNIISTHNVKDVAIDDIVTKMVGRKLEKNINNNQFIGDVALKVDSLCRGNTVKDVSFEVRKGEILGFAGLVGSGRTETMRLIFGADKKDSGSIYKNKILLKIKSPKDAIKNGIAMITEDRKEQGLLINQSIKINTSLSNISDVSKFGWINNKAEQKAALKYCNLLSTKTDSVEQEVSQLSGGNQQKVVIARWLYPDCDIMLFDEPTRGIDIGAKFDIYKLLIELADQGKVIIIVSSELTELMMICNRIAVMSAGKLIKIFDHNKWSQDKILNAAFSEYVVKN